MGRPRKADKKRKERSLDDSETSGQISSVSKRKKIGSSSPPIKHDAHDFTSEDGQEFTSSLLKWYNVSKRDLPWRSLAHNLTPTDRAYAVLVSEVMLQQTQVATVIPYYNKWMARWPTFHHLAQASLNDVNEVWAGMGYYSRAKRLWEAAKKVDGELDNQVPLTSAELQDKLPGVGRYTAGAVASIAFNERAAAVDGNVVRVLSRVRCIGADHTSKVVLDHIWKLSDQLVPVKQPGDYNQAMMDLGATICTPKKPLCKTCPVAHLCLAYQRVQKANPLRELQRGEAKPNVDDIEDVPCSLCLPQPWDIELGVMNFPQKAKKAPPRKEVTLVCIMYVSSKDKDEYFLVKRPQGGLLAGLWEFPSLLFEGSRDSDRKAEKRELGTTLLRDKWGAKTSCNEPHFVTEVPHIFSHIHQLYIVFALKLDSKDDICDDKEQETKWMDATEILSSAISTAMKKVFSAHASSHKKNHGGALKGKTTTKSVDTKTRKVSDFFKTVDKR